MLIIRKEYGQACDTPDCLLQQQQTVGMNMQPPTSISTFLIPIFGVVLLGILILKRK